MSRNQPTRLATRALAVCCLVALVVLAGCSAGTFTEPSGQQGPVGLNVTNAANATHTFEVSVVELPANVTVKLPDGRVGDYETGPGLSTHDPGVNGYYTSVEPPDSARLYKRYRLGTGETRISNISAYPKDFAILVTVHNNSGVVSWVTVTCSGDLTYFGVTMRYYGTDSVYDCG
jgi:hypothetical protein